MWVICTFKSTFCRLASTAACITSSEGDCSVISSISAISSSSDGISSCPSCFSLVCRKTGSHKGLERWLGLTAVASEPCKAKTVSTSLSFSKRTAASQEAIKCAGLMQSWITFVPLFSRTALELEGFSPKRALVTVQESSAHYLECFLLWKSLFVFVSLMGALEATNSLASLSCRSR